ncbi:MAG TPA: zf-HC2 domain-containing protein [Terriglobales bacterium]|nr:zf-HC2 domain-containing protein [Terriglobales bacterium]
MKQRLAAQLPSSAEHPAADTLVAFIEHGLRAPEQQRVLSHLAMCSSCRHAVALATREAAETQPSAAVLPSRSAIKFPAAMRWASAAAVLAVAIGIGVLSYEHQGKPALPLASRARNTSAEKAPSVATEIASHAPAQKITREAPEASPKTRSAHIVARLDHYSSAGAVESKKTKSEAVVGGLIGSAGPQQKPQQGGLQTADAFADGNVANARNQSIENPLSGSRVLSNIPSASPQKIMAPSSAAEPSAPASAKAQLADARNRSSSVASNYTSPSDVTLQARAAPPTASAMKAVASPATAGIAGAVSTRGAYDFAPIAHWTISANGQLQRRSTNGTLQAVEPAPGVKIRTVAAQGIEVWAGGSKPDLSAAQWQQRPVLFHSSDAGETWTRIDGPWQESIQSLMLTAVNSLTVVAKDGRWTTTDAGKTWVQK